MMNWWWTDDELMMNWWCTDDELMMNWWWTDDELMMSWWWTGDELMMSWWWVDDVVMMNWWWNEGFRAVWNNQTEMLDWIGLGWMGYPWTAWPLDHLTVITNMILWGTQKVKKNIIYSAASSVRKSAASMYQQHQRISNQKVGTSKSQKVSAQHQSIRNISSISSQDVKNSESQQH